MTIVIIEAAKAGKVIPMFSENSEEVTGAKTSMIHRDVLGENGQRRKMQVEEI